MRHHRLALVGLLVLLAFGMTACSSDSESSATTSTDTTTSTEATSALPLEKRGIVTIRMAEVGDPGNKSVGVVQTFGGPSGQFVDPPKGTGIYKSCADAPAAPPPCLTVGGVDYEYGIGEYEVTVDQYVTFLNTVDPEGRNEHELYLDNMSPTVWAQYGSISYSADADTGEHYTVAFPEWAQKPFNLGDFRRGARFANSLTNGDVLSKKQESSGGFTYDVYEVRLSLESEKGMYDMAEETPTRTGDKGFAIANNDEWVKAAYYDPKGGGTDSYWAYPTGPFDQPNVSVLDPATGDVTNADDQPLATYNPNDPNSSVDTPGAPPGAAPTWCPPQVGKKACETVTPFNLPLTSEFEYRKTYQANVSTVGQARTPSPWGTYDMGGNVVEVLDSLAPQPAEYNFLREWRYYHGGVANAPAYQVEISAFGYFPEDPLLARVYPWLGFRMAVIGDVG
jgi:hypothetical protein